jgi:hypothetical protein
MLHGARDNAVPDQIRGISFHVSEHSRRSPISWYLPDRLFQPQVALEMMGHGDLFLHHSRRSHAHQRVDTTVIQRAILMLFRDSGINATGEETRDTLGIHLMIRISSSYEENYRKFLHILQSCSRIG